MDIKSLKTLVAIADHRSFRTAADALEMSVSNVSLQVQNLEEHFQTKLFDRSSRPPTLTDAGSNLVVKARDLLVSWDNLNENVEGGSRQGVLKIGAVHTAVAGAVSVALGRLRKRDSGLFIQLGTALTTQLIKQLENHSIDCAIVTRPESPVIDMQFIPIAQEELGVIAHKDAVGKNYKEVLLNNPYLRFNRHATLAQQIDAELKARDIQVSSTMEITTLDAIESLVKNGLGVSIVPIGKSVRSLPRGIRVWPFKSPSVFRTLGLLIRNDCPRMHLVESLLTELHRAYDTKVG